MLGRIFSVSLMLYLFKPWRKIEHMRLVALDTKGQFYPTDERIDIIWKGLNLHMIFLRRIRFGLFFFSRFSGILNAKALFIHFLFFVYVCMLPITGQSVTIRKI